MTTPARTATPAPLAPPDAPVPASTLGADLRALRRARGLTLSALALALGRSVGWISQVERDISRPAIADLRALAQVLDVPLSLFFGHAQAPEPERGRIVRAHSRRSIGNAQAGLVEQLLSPDLTDDFEVVHSTFAPGAALPELVSRPTQEVGYLLSGRLNMEIGGQVFALNPGDSFRIRGEAFRWENPYCEPAIALWVIAPPVY